MRSLSIILVTNVKRLLVADRANGELRIIVALAEVPSQQYYPRLH